MENKSSNNALSVAKYIATTNNIKSLVKLQKILYFTYIDYLKITDKKLFNEEFEAWIHGPVCREVFNYVRINHDIEFKSIKPLEVLEEDKKIIQKIVKNYINFESDELIFLTHETEPWKKARKGLSAEEYSDKKIDFQDINEYAKNKKF